MPTVLTELAIQEIPSGDCRFLRLADNSNYNPDVPIENGLLEITPPGFDCAVVINVLPMFNIVTNSSLLKIMPALTYSGLSALPDGIYHIKYSIRPNNQVQVEYYHLRNCRQMQRYVAAICWLYDRRKEMTIKEFNEKRAQLRWIKELIDAAKWRAEECDKPEEGMDLYNEADALLDGFSKICNCF